MEFSTLLYLLLLFPGLAPVIELLFVAQLLQEAQEPVYIVHSYYDPDTGAYYELFDDGNYYLVSDHGSEDDWEGDDYLY